MIVYETAADYVQPLHQRSCKGWETKRLFVLGDFRVQRSRAQIGTPCVVVNLLRMATEIFRVKR